MPEVDWVDEHGHLLLESWLPDVQLGAACRHASQVVAPAPSHYDEVGDQAGIGELPRPPVAVTSSTGRDTIPAKLTTNLYFSTDLLSEEVIITDYCFFPGCVIFLLGNHYGV